MVFNSIWPCWRMSSAKQYSLASPTMHRVPRVTFLARMKSSAPGRSQNGQLRSDSVLLTDRSQGLESLFGVLLDAEL